MSEMKGKTAKSKKKWLIPVIIISVLAIVIVVIILVLPKNIPVVDVLELKKGSISETVNSTGVIESKESTQILSQNTFKIDEVNAKVGDFVKEGDALCVLNPADLEAQLKQLQASIGKVQSSANQGTNEAQRRLENTEEVTVESAEKGVKAAEKAITDYESALLDAEFALEEAMESYRNVMGYETEEWVNTESFNQTLPQRSARNKADQAERNRDQIKQNILDSRQDLVDAEDKLVEVKSGDSYDIQSAKDSLTSSKIQNNFGSEYLQIEELKKKIEDTTIRAPKDGYITLSNAEEGMYASGLLFVIEDLKNFKVETNVREHAVNSIDVGTKAIIKSEASGDLEYLGTVSFISPTASKAPDGSVASTNVEFGVTVDVLDKDDNLKVGMNTRITLIVSEKENVFTLPFNSLRLTDDGQNVIYIATPAFDGSDDTYTITSVIVETGIESDLIVELLEGDIKEGSFIVENPDLITEGMIVKINITGGQNLLGEEENPSHANVMVAPAHE